jgi:hypothetical protein
MPAAPIRLYLADLDIRIVTLDSTLLRHLTLDTSRTYQPSGLPRSRVRVPAMTRDIT